MVIWCLLQLKRKWNKYIIAIDSKGHSYHNLFKDISGTIVKEYITLWPCWTCYARSLFGDVEIGIECSLYRYLIKFTGPLILLVVQVVHSSNL